MAKDGLKNEELISELLSNGSSAIDTRNDFGVHIFEGSDLDDGVVSGRLSRPKYNIDELEKSVNIKITELVSPPPRLERQTVPIEVYNAATQSIADRDNQIGVLNGTVSDLRSDVSSLQSEVQSLDIEIDGVKNSQGISENQTQIANQRTISTISQLQFSIQKATQEAIQRASLQARNDVLLTENASLRELLYGKTAQQQAGAKLVGNLLTVNWSPKTEPNEPPIRGSQKWKRERFSRKITNFDIVFPNGSSLTFFNPFTEVVTVKLSKDGDGNWYSISPLEFTLEPNATRVLEVSGNKNWSSNDVTKSYIGILRVTASSNGNVDVTDIETKIRRYEA
jgi:regulator of replication initiation timing